MAFEDNFPVHLEEFPYRKTNQSLILNSNNYDRAINLMKKNKIKSLELNPNYFKGDNFEFLPKFDFIEGINILLEGFDITPINKLTKLKKIALQHKCKGTIDFTNFPELEDVFIDWKTKGSETIFQCYSLKRLRIYYFDRYELLELSNLRKLEYFSLCISKVVSLKGIENLTNIKSILLYHCRNLDSFKGIESLINLEEFRIESGVKAKDLDVLEDLPKLKIFFINDKIESINFLRKSTSLEEFYLAEKGNVLDGGLSLLYNLYKKGILKTALFRRRKHYSHTPEDLGYVMSAEMARILRK